MFDRIVVPVDGSALAETVFPYVRLLRRAFGSSVTLVQAIDVTAGVFSLEALSAARAKEAADQAPKGAEEYLSAVEMHIEGANHVTKHGAAVDVIIEEAAPERGLNADSHVYQRQERPGAVHYRQCDR